MLISKNNFINLRINNIKIKTTADFCRRLFVFYANIYNKLQMQDKNYKKEEPQLRELRVEALDWCG